MLAKIASAKVLIFVLALREIETSKDHRPTSTMYLFYLHSLLVNINKEIIEISLAMPPAEEKLQHPSSEG